MYACMYVCLSLIYLGQCCEMDLFLFAERYTEFKLGKRRVGKSHLLQA